MLKKSNEKFIEKITEGIAGIIPPPIIGGVFAFFNNFSILSGILWGLGAGIALLVIYTLGSLVWRQIEKALDAGRRWPYILAGLLAGLIISTSLALSLGEATCLEVDYDNRGGTCVERGNDGYAATEEQRWNKFWGTLPVATVISLLIAIYIHKNRTRK
jgi:hypothetical protein